MKEKIALFMAAALSVAACLTAGGAPRSRVSATVDYTQGTRLSGHKQTHATADNDLGALPVDLPAGIPEVTAVGGTQFREASGGTYWQSSNNGNGSTALSYIPEAAWNDGATNDPAAGGGGTSKYLAKPSWQVASGVQDSGRNVPDVSLNSSAEHDGYLVYSSGKLEL